MPQLGEVNVSSRSLFLKSKQIMRLEIQFAKSMQNFATKWAIGHEPANILQRGLPFMGKETGRLDDRKTDREALYDAR